MKQEEEKWRRRSVDMYHHVYTCSCRCRNVVYRLVHVLIVYTDCNHYYCE